MCVSLYKCLPEWHAGFSPVLGVEAMTVGACDLLLSVTWVEEPSVL